MLIPSIDLKNGAVVQLVQGEKLAIEDADVFRWVERFASFPKVLDRLLQGMLRHHWAVS